MTPALLLAAIAHADPAYDRLFGPAPAEATAEVAATDPAAELPPWLAPVGLVGAVLAMGLHLRHRRAPPAPGRLRVVQREPTGERGSLLLVEVLGEDGGRRRLLVGTGAGPPVLVADLGEEAAPEAPTAVPSAGERASFASRLAEEVLAERGLGPAGTRRAPRRFDPDELAPLDDGRAFPARLSGEAVRPERRVAR